MQPLSLFALRVTTGLLIVWWGLDKLVNVGHAVAVSERFYLGVVSSEGALQAFGVAQTVLGLLIVAGLFRRLTYPALLAITGATALGVWRSIVDPWGWVLEGSNALFYPSAIIVAGALVLFAFRDHDVWHLDAVVGRPRR